MFLIVVLDNGLEHHEQVSRETSCLVVTEQLRLVRFTTLTLSRSADISPKEDYRMMHRFFLYISEEFFDFFISFCRSIRYDDAHTIHHTMNMGINTDKWHVVEMREDNLRSFYSDSWESD